jgi:hypothetical protein
VTDVDGDKIRALAVAARDGDPAGTPPLAATQEAPEIGRRIAAALDAEMHNGKLGDDVRRAARLNLVGLAAHGGAAYGRALLREGKIRVSRRGDVFLVSSGYAIPAVIASNGEAEAEVAATDAEGEAADDEHAAPPAVYVQFDLMTWAQFHALYAALNRRYVGLGAVLTAFDEIAKLEALYPTLTVGAAMDAAGLDRDTMIPFIDLDDALGDDAAGGMP